MFHLKCAECERKLTAETAKAVRAQATGVYSLVCLSCINDACAQQEPNY